MSQDAESLSVYELITNLVEVILKSNNKPITSSNVKVLRSKAFDLLLFKKQVLYDPYWLEDCFDYQCHFLAWVYSLKHTFHQPKMADTLETSIQKIIHSNLDATTINSIFHLLLKLRQAPKNISSHDNLHSRLPIAMPKYKLQQRDFQLSIFPSEEILMGENSGDIAQIFTSHSKFDLPDFELNFSIKSKKSGGEKNKTKLMLCPIRESSEENIWDVQCELSKTKFAKKFSWESYEDVALLEDKPFLMEAKTKIFNIVEEIRQIRNKQLDIDEECSALNVRMFSREEYMRDLKLLVVGISSNIFYSINDEFVLNEDICVDGISFETFKNYSMLMIKAGICYKGLIEMINVNNFEPRGIIFTEFCNAVKRYLGFYRAATSNIPSHKGIIQFHAHIKKVSKHLLILASICKVGTFQESPFTTTAQKVEGVDLINFLYAKVFNQPDKQVTMVLYALLFPCLQIYFIKFLNPWLFEGIIEDPYQEFFIRPNPKFLSSRGRTYWTRSFTLCDDAVPTFCYEHSQKIYECGQIANLLKVCVPEAHVFRCYRASSGTQKGSLMRCCITEKQLGSLIANMENYELDVISAGGPPFSLRRLLEMRKDEDLRFNRFLAERKVISVKRIQCERLEKLEKKEICKKESEIYRQEAESIISFYKEIAESASRLDAAITRYNDSIKSINLPIESGTLSSTYSHSNILPGIFSMPQLETVKRPKVEAHKNVDPNASTKSNVRRKSSTTKSVKPSPASLKAKKPAARESISMNEVKLRKPESRQKKIENTGKCVKSEVNKVCKQPIPERTESLNTNKARESKSSTISARKQAEEYKKKVLATEYGIERRPASKTTTPSRVSTKKSAKVLKSEQVLRDNNDKEEHIGSAEEKEGLTNVNNNDDNKMVVHVVNYIKEHKFELEKININRTDSYNLIRCTSSKMIAESSRNDNPLRIPYDEVQTLNFQFIQDFLTQSIQIPINIQLSLVKSQQLKHFINERKYLMHLENLRNLYFLLDGGFARKLTELLFSRIDDLDAFDDLFSQQIVNNIMIEAIEDSIVQLDDDARVSLSYVSIAKAPLSSTTLHDVFTLDCVSMTYETKWPLNILFPTKCMTKYAEIFKFLIKVHRVSWILQKIYMDLKMLRKEHRTQLKLLDLSEQYQKMQLWRHTMSHFVTTFQNYLYGEVLQSSWASFQFVLLEVDDFNDLYNAHAIYMRQIHFLCFLHQKSLQVREIILNIFNAILKFHDFLRSQEWKIVGSEFVHVNYFQMEVIFKNFLALVKYFLKSCSKIAKTSYQTQFNQLIDLLDINLFYSTQETLADRINPF